ncbi:tachykinin-like peptides receptor 99D isoform X2 [Lingula anatina]|nr:tachykinin-like peptides receptor 99D isoform X2 [Lingula anatina]|eukprot:XP_013411110.1 tachykinin-like peptides receptor 99D isoform X2 [Lingula anatina]
MVGIPAILVGGVARVTDALMPDGSAWYQCQMNWAPEKDLSYNIFLTSFEYFIPLMVLLVTYMRISARLWSGERIGENTPTLQDAIQAKRRVVKMLIVVVLLFAVCWLPYHVFFLLQFEHDHIFHYDGIQYIWLVVFWVAMSNTMFNPIVYVWMNKRFRCGFKSFFRWLPCVHYGRDEMKVLFNSQASYPCMTLSEDSANPPFLLMSRMRYSRNY